MFYKRRTDQCVAMDCLVGKCELKSHFHCIYLTGNELAVSAMIAYLFIKISVKRFLHIFTCLCLFVYIEVITVSDNEHGKPVVKKVSEKAVLQLVPSGFSGEQES